MATRRPGRRHAGSHGAVLKFLATAASNSRDCLALEALCVTMVSQVQHALQSRGRKLRVNSRGTERRLLAPSTLGAHLAKSLNYYNRDASSCFGDLATTNEL